MCFARAEDDRAVEIQKLKEEGERRRRLMMDLEREARCGACQLASTGKMKPTRTDATEREREREREP